MKFDVNIGELKTALDKIITIPTSKKSADSEITNCLFLSLKNNVLLISTTGFSIIAYVTIKCEGENGTILIEAKKFHNLLGALDQKDVLSAELITGRTDHLHIKIGKKKYKFKAVKEEFPTPVTDGYFKNVELAGEELLKLLVKGAWATKELKKEDELLEEDKVLSGVQFTFDESFTVLSTDLRKIAIAQIPWKNDYFNVVVPDKLCKVIVSALTKFKPKSKKQEMELPRVTFSVQQDYIRFNLEGIYYVGKVVEGAFPSLLKAMPKFDYSTQFNRKDFLASVKRLAPFTDSIKRMILLKVNPEHVVIESFNISDKLPSSEELISNADFSVEVGLGSDHLDQILRHIDDDEVTIYFSKENLKPVKVTGSDSSYFYYQQTLRTD